MQTIFKYMYIFCLNILMKQPSEKRESANKYFFSILHENTL